MSTEPPKLGSKKSLNQPASIKGSAILDEGGDSRNNSIVMRNSVVLKARKLYARLIEWYCENVSYRQETILLLLLLIPYLVAALALVILNNFVLYSNSYGIYLKVCTILVSFWAIYGVEVLNRRHALLRYITKITSGEATLKTISDAAKGQGKSRILTFLSYLFFACITAAELSIGVEPQHSFYGYGTALKHDINRYTPNPNLNLFDKSIGAQWACSDCVGVSTNDALYIPITVRMLNTDSGHTQLEAIMNSVQDVVEMETNCFYSRPVNTRPVDSKLNMYILDTRFGYRSSFMDIEISSFDDAGNLKSRRCNLSTRDWSAYVDINYYIATTGTVARRGVHDIKPVYKHNCTVTGVLCLDAPSIDNLGETLIKSTFIQPMYSIEKAYSQKVSLFPDPAIHTSDHDYSESVSNSIGMMFLIAMSQFATTTEAISLEVDTSRVMLHVDASISILAMAIAILTAVLAITLILIDLLRIRKEPDELLRFVSEAIVPGRTFVESSAVLIKEVIKNKIPVEEWDSIPIRFGEDRSTIQDPLGRLRFGRKKDVIKFKPGRAYY